MSELSEEAFTALYQRRVDMVYRVCFAYMKHSATAEDAVQETFVRLLTHPVQFADEHHEIGWLVRTTTNICKDTLKSWWRRKTVAVTSVDREQEVTHDATLMAVLSLPDRYKTLVYLYYYEGNTTGEIAEFLHRRESTVRNHLAQARKLLREQLGNFDEEH